MINFGKYIGIKYKYHGSDFSGCDCFGLCRLIFREEKNIDFPSFREVYKEHWYKEKQNHIVENIKPDFGFYKIDPPYKLLDGLIFYHGNTEIANHIGLWIGSNKFIHVYIGGSSIVEKFEEYWKSRFYCGVRFVNG